MFVVKVHSLDKRLGHLFHRGVRAEEAAELVHRHLYIFHLIALDFGHELHHCTAREPLLLAHASQPLSLGQRRRHLVAVHHGEERFLLGRLQIRQLYRRSQGNPSVIHHLEDFGDQVREADITLDLRCAVAGLFTYDLRGSHPLKIGTNLVQIFGATCFTVKSLHFHLVREGFLRRQNVLSLQVAVHHSNDGLLVGQLADNHRHGVHPQCLAGRQPPMAGDQLISAALLGPRQGGRQHAGVGNALHQLPHLRVVFHLEGVALEGRQLRQRKLLHLGLAGVRTLLLGHEQLVIAAQAQINGLVFQFHHFSFCCNQRSYCFSSLTGAFCCRSAPFSRSVR